MTPAQGFPPVLEVSSDELLWMGRAQEGRSRWVIHAHPSIPTPRGVAGCQWLHGYGLGMSLPSPLAMQGVYK